MNMPDGDNSISGYSYFGTWSAAGGLGALARTTGGVWERYQYRNQAWAEDRQVESEVLYSGDWYPATLQEVELSISKYEQS